MVHIHNKGKSVKIDSLLNVPSKVILKARTFTSKDSRAEIKLKIANRIMISLSFKLLFNEYLEIY